MSNHVQSLTVDGVEGARLAASCTELPRHHYAIRLAFLVVAGGILELTSRGCLLAAECMQVWCTVSLSLATLC